MADLLDDPPDLSAASAAAGELDPQGPPPPPTDADEHARALLAAYPVVEGYADLAELPDPEELPPLRAEGVGTQFWSLHAGPGDDAVVETLRRIDTVRTLVAACPEHLRLARTTAEIADAANCGRAAALLGPVSATALGGSLATLRAYHLLGVLAVTLSGLDRFDRFAHDAVREMNRLGVLVDLSGATPDTMRGALAVTKAPVLLTRGEPEALPDDVLALLGENGGVCMIPVTEGASATADALDRLRALAGPGSVGLSHCPDPGSGYRELVVELLQRGWPDQDVRALTRTNATRALRESEFRSRATRLRRPA
ncbi:membrane dipeptidase [Streptomyces sp. NPDC006551]|uniref:membrane dipeptidase n=1 Tax=Streptomyces sp. NPDC006551 TaxID=3157178 RepID=UPI0033A1D7B1